MKNNIASMLFEKGIMPDDFISYSTYAAVGELVEEVNRLKEENTSLAHTCGIYVVKNAELEQSLQQVTAAFNKCLGKDQFMGDVQ